MSDLTDDLFVAYGGLEASRLRADTFTTQDLLNIVHDRGYVLGEGHLRQWVHRGLFPPAKQHLKAKGKPGIWQREHVIRLLDLCSINAVNSDTSAARFGLWLLGYEDIEEVPTIRASLQDQLERMERSIYGRVLERTSSTDYDEATLDTIGESIQHTVNAATHLDTFCAGLQTPLSDADLESLQDLHPDRCAGATTADLRQATLPSGTSQLGELVRVLEHNVHWNVPGIRSIQNISNVLASVLEPSASQVTSEQRIQLQRSIIGTVLWSCMDMLPQLRGMVEDASENELRQARLQVEHLIIHTLGWQRVFPDPSLTGLGRIGKEYTWDYRRLFATPAFFPLMAYLIAVQVYNFRKEERCLHVRSNVLPVALDQLARLSRESTSRVEAFLAVIFSAIPAIRGEVIAG